LLADEIADDNFDDLVAQLIKSDRRAYGPQDDFNPSDARLYSAWARAGLIDEGDFQKWCQNGIKDVDRQSWLKHLKTGGYLIRLMVDLLERGVELEPGLGYQDALSDHGKSLLSAPSVPKSIQGRTNYLTVPLSVTARRMLSRRLYDSAVAADGDIAPGFLEVYGGEVFNTDFLPHVRDAPYRLFTPILSKRNAPALSVLADLLEGNPKVMENFDSDTAEDFRLRLRDALDGDAEDEASTPIGRIAEALNVERADGSSTKDADS
jgi:hypothetical protein